MIFHLLKEVTREQESKCTYIYYLQSSGTVVTVIAGTAVPTVFLFSFCSLVCSGMHTNACVAILRVCLADSKKIDAKNWGFFSNLDIKDCSHPAWIPLTILALSTTDNSNSPKNFARRPSVRISMVQLFQTSGCHNPSVSLKLKGIFPLFSSSF